MKVVTLNSSQFDAAIRKLVESSPENPDVIISILNGGGYLVNSIVKQGFYRGIPVYLTKLQRRNTKKKEKRLISLLLRVLPYPALNLLRRIESHLVKKSTNQININELTASTFEMKNVDWEIIKEAKTVLIIDDAIDSGKTMFQIRNEIQNRANKEVNVFISVVSWTIDNSIISPNSYVFKDTLVRFPWSKDYKGKDFAVQSFSS